MDTIEGEKWMSKYCKLKDSNVRPEEQKLYYTETGKDIAKQIDSVLKVTPRKSTVIETLFPNLSDLDKFKIVIICSIVEDMARKSAVMDFLKSGMGALKP